MKNPDDPKEVIQQNEEQPSPKQPYEPPKATFVPLRIEERLFASYQPD